MKMKNDITQLIKSHPHWLKILLQMSHTLQDTDAVTIRLLKASACRVCYRTCQLPSCKSGLFNPQVRLETLLDFQSKVSKRVGCFYIPAAELTQYSLEVHCFLKVNGKGL